MNQSSKRFHISISTEDFASSLADYTARLGAKPDIMVQGRYARWRTDLLNFTISCKPGQKGGMVRHIGFESEGEQAFREEHDTNGITWEYFSEPQQREEIETRIGAINKI